MAQSRSNYHVNTKHDSDIAATIAKGSGNATQKLLLDLTLAMPYRKCEIPDIRRGHHDRYQRIAQNSESDFNRDNQITPTPAAIALYFDLLCALAD